ncbi:MAG: 4'-phosphopantetheinyl transferase superfamily protein [Luteolibacter sp.]
MECEKTFCHPDEIRLLPVDETSRALQLLQIWTAKESVLKALGTGLSHAPQLIYIHDGPAGIRAFSDTPLEGIANQQIHRLENASLVNHASALSAPSTVNNIRITRSQI